MRRKRRIKLGIFTLCLLLVLVFCGWYARYNYDRNLDSRFLDGALFGWVYGARFEPSPTPTPAEKPKTEREEIEEFGQFLFGEDWQLFRRIIACESSWDVKAHNGRDTGLAQINQVHGIPKRWLENWRVNLVVAYELFKNQGTKPWQASQACWEGEK